MLPQTVDAMRSDAIARAKRRLQEMEKNARRYDRVFPVFASDCLTIRPKVGGDKLFRLNKVQKRFHATLEEQRRETGRVRVIVVKTRQPGISTYVGGRFYHRTSRNNGLRAFVLTHEQSATDNLFEMVKRFHRHNPHAPVTGASSAKELYFSELDSGFEVGTAGTKEVGRSYTIQMLHWSETAYSPNAIGHAAGLLQAVPAADGTEVVLESTANGIGGLFYNMAYAAFRGQGEYQLVFIPWFEHDEYAMEPPEGWTPYPELAEYIERYELTPEQAYWADWKNTELAIAEGSPVDEFCWKFHQEYPATMDLAFRASRKGAFIRGELVYAARQFTAPPQDHAPLVLGVDFATGGGDSDGEAGDANVIIDRQGRAMGRKIYDRFNDKDAVSVAGKVGAAIDKLKPAMSFFDTGGGGAQVYDILVSRGYDADKITLVDFGGKPNDDRKYANKRAEMYGEGRDWLAAPGGADIPDDDLLESEITAIRGKEDFHGRILLWPKAKIRKEFNFSPDGADAGFLTFAETVHVVDDKASAKINPLKGVKSKGWQGA